MTRKAIDSGAARARSSGRAAGFALALLWPLACSVVLAQAPAAARANDQELERCRDAAAITLPAFARDALARIDGLPRQLLALSGYLRARDLAARWSWDEAAIRAFEGSPTQQAALAEIARVQTAFALAHPGYALHVNTQVRSLDLQLTRWNANASVGRAAAVVLPAAREQCRASGPAGFARWLAGWRPPVPANLAVPGLSAHGQGRAYDFQVVTTDGRLVAGTDSRRIDADWIAGGWADKLAAAVSAASTRLKGPLRSPREPWHYDYDPGE